MKRWQDRGEVQDSDDDEDLSLGTESQASGRASKRTRISSDGGIGDGTYASRPAETIDGVDSNDQEEDALWLQPPRGAVYGKKTATNRPTSAQTTTTSRDDDHGESVVITTPVWPFQSLETDNTDADFASTSSLLHQSQRPSNAREVVAVRIQAEPNPKQHSNLVSMTLSSPLMDRDVSPPGHSTFRFPRLGLNTTQQAQDTEPSQRREASSSAQSTQLIQHAVSVAQTEAGNQTLAEQQQRIGGASPAPSSPLSEREVSPPAPEFLQLARVAQNVSSADFAGEDDRSDGEELTQMEELPPDDFAAAVAGRRSLRARKEKQLHPYMLDRLQHQQQFRERGMRPIRYLDQRNAETQNASTDDNLYESSQVSQGHSSPPLRPSSEVGEQPTFEPPQSLAETQDSSSASGDELPNLSDLFGRTLSHRIQHGPKRRRLSYASRRARPSEPSGPGQSHPSQQDELSMPSPPPTSSESMVGNTKASPVAFKFPRTLEPTPLPTPHVPSDVRKTPGEANLRRSRPSTASRPRPVPVVIESSTESSEAESELEPQPADDEHLLRREGKRIKGVLPASWLKLDRAQQNQASKSPARRRASSSPSPVRTMPQKGLAQRVYSRRQSSSKLRDAVTISDDESESDSRTSSPSRPVMWQPKLRFDRTGENPVSDRLIDVDEIEVDWIDPMLKGASRAESNDAKHAKRKKRQPRVTDAFNVTQTVAPDLSEERRAISRAVGVKTRQRKAGQKGTSSGRSRQPPTVHLSILDHPANTQPPTARTPQFVRLAIRRARTQVNHARHSPTRKHIRLATREDTGDAVETLRAWRDGTIAPRRARAPSSRHCQPLSLTDHQLNGIADFESTPSGEPLSEVHQNRQQRMPGPLRRVDSVKRPSARSAAVVRGPEKQQTRLQPIVIADERASALAQDDQPEPRSPTFVQPASRKSFPVQRPSRPYRGAQLESLETDFARNHRASAFEQRMQLLTRTATRLQPHSGDRDLPMSRFLHDPDVKATPRNHDRTTSQSNIHAQTSNPLPVSSLKLAHRPRKRPTRRVDAEAREYRQPSEPLPDVVDVDVQTAEPALNKSAVLQALGPFGTRYATDFDVLPLEIGTFFHESSFIGSGDFAASLDFAGRNLDIPTGRIRIHVEEDVLEWGAWTEEVAVGLSRIPVTISAALRSPDDILTAVLPNIDYLLRSTVRYFARCLAFSDPVDRRGCVQSLQRFVEDLLEIIAEYADKHNTNVSGRCLQYAVVLARQTCHLSEHGTIPHDLRKRSHDLLSQVVSRLANQVFPAGFAEVRTLYEDNRRASVREAGIRDSDTAICSLVLLHHALKGQSTGHNTFWSTIHRTIDPGVSTSTNVLVLDKIWYNVFTILPALEIDVNGITRLGSRTQSIHDDWTLVKRLVERTLELYPATSSLHGSTINDYVRAILTRCYRLITRWAWWRCESILGTVFDFFGRRGLAQLHGEDCPGSPSFLQDLNHHPSLEVQSEDRSFHIFLKMLGSGLQGMRKHQVCSDKKIGGIAWRFIPSHGRTYRKDTELRQEDLDALRNHHDLLCALYYASPPDHRLRVELLQNLVDHAASHREACRLNVRAWANLASFQMSTDEGMERIDHFIVWFRDLLTTTINQYRLARTEVEQEAAAAKAQGQLTVGQDIVEDTINRNQRQIAATLVDALAAIKRALTASSSLPNVLHLLDGSKFWQVLNLFEPAARRLHGVLDEALNVVKAALDMQHRFASAVESQSGSDESQDYGDLSALQDFASNQLPDTSADWSVAGIMRGPLWHFLSNVFGADIATDDGVLHKAVDVWAQLAATTIPSGKRSWSSYMNGYNSEAWNQLRDTEQKRKYTPYFLSQIVVQSSVDLEETGILTSWLKSLVEREANLKFQHLLTAVLLNTHQDEHLLQNLPFSRSRAAYNITLDELRQRRLGLLSAVLSNMRESYHETMRSRPHALPAIRSAYTSTLSQLMQTMKSNYQEVQTSHKSDVAESEAHGAYVAFVQQVVSFLQQYTTDICQVDRFFTESAAFPLPVGDPTYVVGRLRAYVPKLVENGKRKELAIFIHAVSERAAVDGQQRYLVDQLASAMTGVVERGNLRTPGLRHVLITAIFPAYIESALSTACSWILAVPIIEACGQAAEQMLYDAKYESEESIGFVVNTFATLLHGLSRPVRDVLIHSGLATLPHVQKTLAVIFATARQGLSSLQHMQQVSQTGCTELSMIAELYQLAKDLQKRIHGSDDEFDMLQPLPSSPDLRCQWPDTKDFVHSQVTGKYKNDWYAQDGQYFLRRGRTSVEVVADLKDEEEEKANLLGALKSFCESYETIFDGRGRFGYPHDSDFGLGDILV